MRVLAVGRMSQSWAELMRDAGHEVAVLTSTPGGHDLRPYSGDPAVESHNAAVLGRALGQTRPDVVAWWSMTGMSMALITQVAVAGVPAVAAACDDWFARPPATPAVFDPIASWVFTSAELRSLAFRAGLRRRAAPVAPPPGFERCVAEEVERVGANSSP